MIFAKTRLLCAAVVLGFGLSGGGSDMTEIQCGNLIYQGTKSSVCFANRFLSETARETNLRVARGFYPVKLDSDQLFDTPFCVFSGDKTFTLTDHERENLKKYLLAGGFILASPSCSDEHWDASFRREIETLFSRPQPGPHSHVASHFFRCQQYFQADGQVRAADHD